ncbi:MAG: hypothetical protein MH219_15410 [Marinobacter sp.]|nr:hypothetical protein [Marinobacter sp.]MCL1480526.1 hypothetical protein [Marinobacter sp.]MCL1484068.1 hypothetical protein [Marinobacter sp.]
MKPSAYIHHLLTHIAEANTVESLEALWSVLVPPMYVGFQLNEADYVAYRRAGRAAAEGVRA